MPQPDEFSHAKFPVIAVLYNDTDFSVAYGLWEGSEPRIGMRWNGHGVDAGYPKLFNRPVWFMLPAHMTIATLKGLLEAENADKERVAEILRTQFSS